MSVERAHCRARDDGRRVDILGKEVTSNGHLITLLNKVGYDYLAGGLWPMKISGSELRREGNILVRARPLSIELQKPLTRPALSLAMTQRSPDVSAGAALESRLTKGSAGSHLRGRVSSLPQDGA